MTQDVLALTLGAWLVLALAAALALVPLLRSARRADARSDVARRRSTWRGRAREHRAPAGPAADGPGALDRLLALAAQAAGAERCTLFVRGEDGEPRALAGTGGTGGRRFAAGAEPARFALAEGRTVVGRPGTGVVAVPAARDDRLLGALVATGSPGWWPGPEELELLAEMAVLCASALAGAARAPDPRVTESRARALQAAAAVWDERPEVHDDGPAALAEEAARRLGLRGAEVEDVRLAARLRDVGKLRMPGAVLHRRRPLTRSGWELARRHPAWGAELLAHIPGLEAVAALVLLHHERRDGQGYPARLAGDRVPLAAQIVGTCDAFAAMTIERPYRPALSPEEALRQLAEDEGRCDPSVLRTLEGLLRTPTVA